MKISRLIILAIKGFGILAAVLVMISVAFWICWRWGYYDEFEDIKKLFSQMNNVELVRAGGNEDMTFEDIYALIKVRNKGEMYFAQLTRHSFSGGERIIIGSIGGLEIRCKGYGYWGVLKLSTLEPVKSEYFGSSIQLNKDSPFVKEFPFKIETIQDAILHYDDIYTIIKSWPRCPDYKSISDSKGNVHCYCFLEDPTSYVYPSGCNRKN